MIGVDFSKYCGAKRGEIVDEPVHTEENAGVLAGWACVLPDGRALSQTDYYLGKRFPPSVGEWAALGMAMYVLSRRKR